MNDWSARDVQAWEYQPLGPFWPRTFVQHFPVGRYDGSARTFSEAAAQTGSRTVALLRAKSDFTFDIQLEANLRAVRMKSPQTITRTNFQNLYWSVSQQLAHHAVGGCNLQPGDLLASGTISGATEESRGCMLELTWRGANPLKLKNGEERKWLEDGDVCRLPAGAREVVFASALARSAARFCRRGPKAHFHRPGA